jgi:hypothetical protein
MERIFSIILCTYLAILRNQHGATVRMLANLGVRPGETEDQMDRLRQRTAHW